MHKWWQRFFTKRTVTLLFFVSLAAMYSYLSSGLMSKNNQLPVYEQSTLRTDDSCNVIVSSCTSNNGVVTVELTFPKAVSALIPFPVEVKLQDFKNNENTKVLISFEMKGMNMGKISHRLEKNSKSSRWVADVVLPVCSSGRHDWSVNIEVIEGLNLYQTKYSFVIE